VSVLSIAIVIFPIIRSLDKAGRITPPGYCTTLAGMIAGFMGLFALALAWSLIQGAR
jgi:hypothetical protein